MPLNYIFFVKSDKDNTVNFLPLRSFPNMSIQGKLDIFMPRQTDIENVENGRPENEVKKRAWE